MEPEAKNLRLPAEITGPVEIGQLLRELEAIDNTMLEQRLREDGDDAQMLKTSHLMRRFAEANKLNLLHQDDRVGLRHQLETAQHEAPVLHMSFSSDPSPAFLERLVTWLRQNIHPDVLLTVGVQPTIAAGCVVRSTNKYFDFSLRENFAGKREVLLQAITGQPAESEPHE